MEAHKNQQAADLQEVRRQLPGTNVAYPGNALRPIDRKVIERPWKYSGKIEKFVEWRDKLCVFLDAQDKRWSPLLNAIEFAKMKFDDKDTEAQIEKELDEATDAEKDKRSRPVRALEIRVKRSAESKDITDLYGTEECRQQLYTYLEQFTEGSAHTQVIAGRP